MIKNVNICFVFSVFNDSNMFENLCVVDKPRYVYMSA